MKVVDTNVLLLAVNVRAPFHAKARAWMEAALSGSEAVALPWTVILGFVRVSTLAHVLPNPLTPEQALTLVSKWLAAPCATIVHPTGRHFEVLKGLLVPLGLAGNLTMDAHLAALAIEHGAEVVSGDADFSRFPGVRWTNPLA